MQAARGCGAMAHHSMRLDAVDEDGHWPHAVGLEAAHQLCNVPLLRDHVLAVQQHRHRGCVGVARQSAVPRIPLQVLGRRREVAVVVRVQAACTAHKSVSAV